MQPVLDAEIAGHREFAPELAGVDMDPVLVGGEAEWVVRSLAPRAADHDARLSRVG